LPTDKPVKRHVARSGDYPVLVVTARNVTRQVIAKQIALALRDEVKYLEKADISIV
jgi:methionine synthase II (cobalamin-independent)